jgi:Cof subfamily protein (haloacid dehalogenase superfamily)
MLKKLPDWRTHIEELYPFSKIKLIAVDLDGTFLVPGTFEQDNAIFPKLYSSLRAAPRKPYKKESLILTLATGRTLTGASNLLEQLDIQANVPIILYNGSVIVRSLDFQLIEKKVIPVNAFFQVVSKALQYKVRVFAYSYYGPFNPIRLMPPPYECVWGWSSLDRPIFEFNRMEVSWQDDYRNLDNISPSAILVDTSSDPKCFDKLVMEFLKIPNITATKSGSRYIEIRPISSNKAEALAVAASYLNLKREETMALGDNDNDSEMLSWSGIGVSVSNASVLARDASDYVSHYSIARGVVEVLRLVKHAKKYYSLGISP